MAIISIQGGIISDKCHRSTEVESSLNHPFSIIVLEKNLYTDDCRGQIAIISFVQIFLIVSTLFTSTMQKLLIRHLLDAMHCEKNFMQRHGVDNFWIER